MFDFLRKKEGEVPDVGKEEQFEEDKNRKGRKEKKIEEPEEETEEEPEENAEEEVSVKPKKGKTKIESSKRKNIESIKSFEIEKLSARIEATNSLLKGYSERLGQLSEQIGEIRAMALNNEKSIGKISTEAEQTVDIVREVKPERLRIDYQKAEMRANELEDKIEANKQLMETIMNEIKDLRKKAGIFIGTDALLKLNDEVKKDLIEIQRTGNRVRLNTEKSEEIFIELKRGFSEYQKLAAEMDILNSSYSGVGKEIEKLKLDYSNIVSLKEFNDFKKTFNTKFTAVDGALGSLENMKKENEKISYIAESALSIARRNKEDINDIALTIGDDHIKRVSDYENQLAAILRIVDILAGQISEVRRKIGMPAERKISIDNINKRIIQEDKIKMSNVEIHPEIAKNLIPKQEEVANTIRKISPQNFLKIKKNMENARKIDVKPREEIANSAKDFVRKARMRGYSDKMIFEQFQKKGWKKDLINYFLKIS